VAGLALFLGVDTVASQWPWALTPLVAKVTAAWLLAFAAALAVREDVSQLGPTNTAYLVFGAVQLLAVSLHHDDVTGGGAAAAYLLVATWVALTGAAGLLLRRRDVRR
jgi:hypothetical protein